MVPALPGNTPHPEKFYQNFDETAHMRGFILHIYVESAIYNMAKYDKKRFDQIIHFFRQLLMLAYNSDNI